MKIVEEKDIGLRLDAYLAQGELSRSMAVQLIESGNVLVGGKQVKKNYKICVHDQIEVEVPAIKTLDTLPQQMDLDIRYEDGDVLVVNKPKGVVVHPAPGNEDGTLVNGILAYCKDLSGIGGVARPGIVHRIDKETSGLLIIAKNDQAHSHLSAQLKTRTLSRTYFAVVLGGLKADSGKVETLIGRSPKDRKRMGVTRDGRQAVTHYEVLERYRGYTLVKCKLETGRTHQIRVHMAHIGHPIVGDLVYGRGDKSGIQGQCLHAGQLIFVHPKSGEQVTVEAPLPQYFYDFVEKLRKQDGGNYEI